MATIRTPQQVAMEALYADLVKETKKLAETLEKYLAKCAFLKSKQSVLSERQVELIEQEMITVGEIKELLVSLIKIIQHVFSNAAIPVNEKASRAPAFKKAIKVMHDENIPLLQVDKVENVERHYQGHVDRQRRRAIARIGRQGRAKRSASI